MQRDKSTIYTGKASPLPPFNARQRNLVVVLGKKHVYTLRPLSSLI